MKILVKNVNLSISISLTILKLAGYWSPDDLTETQKIIYKLHAALTFTCFLGLVLIFQLVDLFKVWGDLPLMTATAFIFFTDLAHAGKIFNVLYKKSRVLAIIDDSNKVLSGEESDEGKAIIKRCDRETTMQQIFYFVVTYSTLFLLFSSSSDSSEDRSLPIRVWYPYDPSKSPAYELTYLHQVVSVVCRSSLNMAKDTLVTALIAQFRCRLKLLGLSLRTICDDMHVSGRLTPQQQQVVGARLRACVREHQAVLDSAQQLQDCFSVPTFVQFAVSRIIICVTAFQLVSQTGSLVRTFSLIAYIVNMMYQLFIYCYQGHHLSEESSEVALAAYECPWYMLPVPLRRTILMIMLRTHRIIYIVTGGFITLSLDSFMISSEVALAAYECPWYMLPVPLRRTILMIMLRTHRIIYIVTGGFITLSLDSFMILIKASYSFFTLLQQVTE